MGYEPLPIKPRTKEAVAKGWNTVLIDAAQIEAWSREFPHHGIGLRTGKLVAIDIDVLDADRAHGWHATAFKRFGPTLMRVGRWPKHLLLYRTDEPFAKMEVPQVQILAQGQQFVAFGIHPVTQKPYDWPLGETPMDLVFDQLPLVRKSDIEAFLAEGAALFPAEETGSRRGAGQNTSPVAGVAPVRNGAGQVVDHRDSWLSTIAYHAVWDAIDAGGTPDANILADRVWARFTETTDLTRGKKDGQVGYGLADALRKVKDKLQLAKTGRLPARPLPEVQPVVVDPGLPLEVARARLDAVIGRFATRAKAWHANSQEDVAPRIGIRASVGLGKTAVSRRHLLELQARLKAKGLPHHLLIVTPSLALADESAEAWQQGDLKVAVHRGYEAKQPGRKEIMCQDIDMVRMATKAGLPVFPNTCLRKSGGKCHAFNLCPKQWNREDVEKADIVLAAYDALYTGLPISPEKLALVVIDEGCWVRSVKETGLYLHDLRHPDAVDEQRSGDADHEAEAWAALFALRYKAADALQANGRGPLSRQVLLDQGLSVSDCATARALEIQLRVDPGLRPGMYQSERKKGFELSKAAQKSVSREALFLAMERLLAGEAEQDGRIVLRPSDPETGVQAIKVMGLHQFDPALAKLPILHLDATLRHDLAETVLPGVEVTEITAEMPHMLLISTEK
ncbi:bifunctional DNA primase/polymerase [Neogemmobacter tilapiae]|nr:bifunctional DNA primase/polymerase [Gemmobacter tilapiae]